ncbi:MAG TPA: hypothetical protein VMW19_14885 [Myxococcota bacterium]|nr:hypothetical protein [Myxococcota bacterium]
MPRSKRAILLGLAASLACASAPRIEHGVGSWRSFSAADRFAPATLGVLAAENPGFDEPALENLQELLEKSIGWHGLTLAEDDAADWLVSCAFRKRVIWREDISRQPVTEPWYPHATRVLGTRNEYSPTAANDPEASAATQPWLETLVELRLRSRRTGTIGWSIQRVWGRDREDLPEDELRQTLDLLLSQIRFYNNAPAQAPTPSRD